MILIHKLKRVQHIPQVSFLTYTKNENQTITIPSTAAEGDLVFLYDSASKIIGTVTSVIPSGFSTLKALSVSTNVKNNASYKILGAGDPGTSITGMNDTYKNKSLLVFRKDGGISSVNVAYNQGQGTTGNPTDYTAPAGTAPYIVIAALGGGTANYVDWTSLTPEREGEVYGSITRVAYWCFNEGEETTVAEVMGDWGAYTIVFLCVLELS
jgi:hypothetical protein